MFRSIMSRYPSSPYACSAIHTLIPRARRLFSGPSSARSTRPSESSRACRYEAWNANEAARSPGSRTSTTPASTGPKRLGRARRDDSERPVRPVDVQPYPFGASDSEELGDRVDGPRSDRPRRGHDGDGTVPALPILLDHPTEGIHAHPVVLVDGNQSNGLRSHTEEFRGLLMAVVDLLTRLDAKVRRASAGVHAPPAHVPSGCVVPDPRMSHDVGELTPARVHALGLGRIPEQFLQPVDRLDLDRRGRRPPAPQPDVRVDRGRHEIPNHSDGVRGRGDVGEPPWVADERRQ